MTTSPLPPRLDARAEPPFFRPPQQHLQQQQQKMIQKRLKHNPNNTKRGSCFNWQVLYLKGLFRWTPKKYWTKHVWRWYGPKKPGFQLIRLDRCGLKWSSCRPGMKLVGIGSCGPITPEPGGSGGSGGGDKGPPSWLQYSIRKQFLSVLHGSQGSHNVTWTWLKITSPARKTRWATENAIVEFYH